VQEFLQQLVNGITWGSIYSLIALGYTMVYGILRFINFAHGDVYMVGAYIAYYLVIAFGLSAGGGTVLAALLVLLGAMVGAALLGVIIEQAAYRPLRRQPRLTVLITAIGVSLLLENGGILVFGADPKFFPQILASRSVKLPGGALTTSHQLLVLGGALLLMVALSLVVYKSRVGRAMRALSFNRDAANLMGIPTDRIITFTFALGSALAAAAGVLVALSTPRIDPLMGLLPGLKAFVAAVLGGIGNIPGAMIGGLVLGLAETLVSGYISSTYRDAIAFALLIVILLVRPAGLLGRAVREKV
jgi:branched-chain amino acid transport system permease protein